MANLYIERGLVNRKLISLFNKYFSTKRRNYWYQWRIYPLKGGGKMAEQPTIKTTIQIDRKLWKKMKMEAVMENKTLAQYVEEKLREACS